MAQQWLGYRVLTSVQFLTSEGILIFHFIQTVSGSHTVSFASRYKVKEVLTWTSIPTSWHGT
jgi:hypothetical protein